MVVITSWSKHWLMTLHAWILSSWNTWCVAHQSAKSLTSDRDQVVILGLSDFFGNVIIFVSPIAAVVALPPGDQIVSARFPGSMKALPGIPALVTGVCATGVARRRTTSGNCCDGGAARRMRSMLSVSESSVSAVLFRGRLMECFSVAFGVGTWL